MIVIGIDPGSHKMGWGVIEARGTHVKRLDSGTLTAPKGALTIRLLTLASALEHIVLTHRPVSAGVESVFHAKNSQSALVLGQARGAALVTLARLGVDVCEYAPTQIKSVTTGAGRADKAQVQHMVRMLLGVQKPMGPDESDALAAALCHAHLHDSRVVQLARQISLEAQ